jgi:hypothetical protein
MDTLASVTVPFQRRAPKVTTRSLIDTTDHTDAVLLGLEGPVDPEDRDGAKVTLTTDEDGFHVLTITTCEGSVELTGPMVSMLCSELGKAGVSQ